MVRLKPDTTRIRPRSQETNRRGNVEQGVSGASGYRDGMSPENLHFDLQVNGYGGVDFNKDGLTADELHRACARLEADGVSGFLATIITEQVDLMCGRLATLVALCDKDPLAKRLIAGFHIEGPFINETDGYRGAHPRDAIRPAAVDEMSRLLDAAGGLTRL